MDKSLTIEELKVLKEEDWVWFIGLTGTEESCYKQINEVCVEEDWISFEEDCGVSHFADYNKTWLAYKNKEEADAKGEIVELPCKIGDEAWFIVTKGKLSKIIETYVTKFQVTNDVIEVHFDKTIRVIRFHSNGTRENVYDIYLDKSKAERRLAELTKE